MNAGAKRAVLVVLAFGVIRCVSDSVAPPDAGSDGSTTPMMDASGTMDGPGDGGCGAAPTTTFYVNGATGNDANNGGSPTCAFKTISAALAASKSAYNATINVAEGTYSVGETFPLIVDRGRSIIGAGAAKTIIQGSSAPYNTSGTGSFLDYATHFLTMIVGDVMGGAQSLGATTISGVTVLPANLMTPTANYIGLACIAGNAPNTGAAPPLPMPNLIVKGVTVGPNFDLGLAVGYSTSLQAACNPLVTASTFTGVNIGIALGVCGYSGDGGAGNPVASWPSAQIGSGQSADANTFKDTIAGVVGGGCGSAQSINSNHFESGYQGIVLISAKEQYFEILANTFDGSGGTNKMGIGLYTNAGATISKLNDNTFTNISRSTAADQATYTTTGYALRLGVARVLQAQRNKIINNDNGILIENAYGAAANFDFSSDGGMNNANQIFCNSAPMGGNAVGYDLILPQLAMPLNFSGNQWDHSPPSMATMNPANGTDIVATSQSVNTASWSPTMQACSNGRVH